MAHVPNNPIAHPEVQLANGRDYVIGYGISLVTMAVALVVVVQHAWGEYGLAVAVAVCAIIALLAQAVLWERLDFSRAQLWITISVLLFIPLYVLTIGLTAWMFASLYTRTFLPGVMP